VSDSIPPRLGAFVPAGSRYVVLAGTRFYRTPEEADAAATSMPLHTSRDMTPAWIRVALVHLADARAAHVEVLGALQTGDEASLGVALERESAAGMQATVAAAIAMDALYASAKLGIGPAPETTPSGRARRTSRWRQVAEVLRRAFSVPSQSDLDKHLRQGARALFDSRDRAVHPSAAAARLMQHPDLGQPTDWRFVTYSYENSLQLVWVAVGFTHRLILNPAKRESSRMTGLRTDLARMLSEVFAQWEDEHGSLDVNPQQGSSA